MLSNFSLQKRLVKVQILVEDVHGHSTIGQIAHVETVRGARDACKPGPGSVVRCLHPRDVAMRPRWGPGSDVHMLTGDFQGTKNLPESAWLRKIAAEEAQVVYSNDTLWPAAEVRVSK